MKATPGFILLLLALSAAGCARCSAWATCDCSMEETQRNGGRIRCATPPLPKRLRIPSPWFPAARPDMLNRR